ncbi:hypothetical protein ACLKA6_007642 [Drosophila palustris]
MNSIFNYQSSKYSMRCATPEQFKDCLVFDEQICYDFAEEATSSQLQRTTTKPMTTTTIKSMIMTTITTDPPIWIPTISTAGTVNPLHIVPLECTAPNKTLVNNASKQHCRWPQIYFIPKVFGALTVKITVDQRDSESSFGLFWFSKTTKEYYMMELLPDEFGLGCYFTMPLQTIVTKLVPNGISVMCFGVVLFMFLGISSVFLVLKQKPIWLKGSKRVITPKYRSGEVVVLPRSHTAEYLQYKEEMISRNNKHRSISFMSRHNSVESLASSGSYMETNLYEMIPTYISFDKVPQVDAPSQPGSQILDAYQTPETFADTGSVRYAQITPRTKRISSDPLPAIPSCDVSDVP